MMLTTEIEIIRPINLVTFADIKVGGFFLSNVGSLFVKHNGNCALLVKSDEPGSRCALVQFSKETNVTLVTKLEVHIG